MHANPKEDKRLTMNLRDKFIWDALIVLSVLSMLTSGYFLYRMNSEKNRFWDTYNAETIGSDATLTSNINQLEQDFVDRLNYRFRLRKVPTDLARVVNLDDDGFKGLYGGSTVRFSAGIQGKQLHAIAHYRDQVYHVQEGDSLAGGIIKQITSKFVIFSKDGESREYSLIPEITTEKKNS